MLIALRDMSLGDHVLERGEAITAEMQAMLPAGRVESLKAQRWVEEISDEQRVARAVADVLARFGALEERVARLEGGGGLAAVTSTPGPSGSGGAGGTYVSGTAGAAGVNTVTFTGTPTPEPKLTKSGKIDGRTKAAKQLRKAS